VLWLAHERYGFVYWVVGFLGLTWLSTLFFGRAREDGPQTRGERVKRGLASYLTRVLYQETLFFLLPFYAYSTVVPSWNLGLLVLLAVLAVLACLDLVFDRWLRTSPVFSLVFFASVAFAALNLLLPMLLSLDPALATPAAGVGALLTALPLAARGELRSVRATLGLGAAALATLGLVLGFPQLVPPVPLRLQAVQFAAALDRETLEPVDPIGEEATLAELDGRLVVLARVFAPAAMPARVSVDWYRDDEPLRSSREVRITAHAGGFRLWDVLRPDSGEMEPGLYRVVLRTAGGRAFGSSRLRLREGG